MENTPYLSESKKFSLPSFESIDLSDFHHIFEVTPHPYLILTPSFDIVAVNDSYLTATEKARDFMLGKNIFDVFPDNPLDPEATGVKNLKASFQEVLRTKKPHRMVTQRYDIAKEGSRDFEVRYWGPLNIPVLNENNEVKFLIHHVEDVTEKVLAKRRSEIIEESEARFRQIVQKLEEERDLREKFVSALTHDLRTPLTAAKVSSQLIARSPNEPDKIIKFVPRVIESLDRIETMIRDLLDANRLKAGEGIQLEFEECDLVPVINEALSDLSTIHGQRFRLTGEMSLSGRWSRSGMRRIIENLCSNAIKYGSATEPISIDLAKDKSDLILRIHNEGATISFEDQKTLFTQFRRTSNAEKGPHKGWGIGLTLVKGIVEAHGGNIKVESAEGKGTTFIITIPFYVTKSF